MVFLMGSYGCKLRRLDLCDICDYVGAMCYGCQQTMTVDDEEDNSKDLELYYKTLKNGE